LHPFTLSRHFFFVCQLFEQGLHDYTWRTVESADFIETATALVCVDLHLNLDAVQTNCQEIVQLTVSWSDCVLDVFAAQRSDVALPLENLHDRQLYVALFFV
jgi:dynein heavy chain